MLSARDSHLTWNVIEALGNGQLLKKDQSVVGVRFQDCLWGHTEAGLPAETKFMLNFLLLSCFPDYLSPETILPISSIQAMPLKK